jgi:hypothetical protein
VNEPQPVKLLPVIIGIVLTIILLAGLAYISNMRRNIPTTAPQLTIIAPAANAVVDSPLVIRFTSERTISMGHNGWAAGNYHLHADINGVEHMPAARDLEGAGEHYAWTIAAVPSGPVRIRLGWADMQHRAVVSGATDTVRAAVKTTR